MCLGNIVRSPLASALFAQQVASSGKGDFYEIDSAGTGSWHLGESPDSRMRRVAAHHGLIYNHRARQIQPQDLDAFDILIAMDRQNREALFSLANHHDHHKKIYLLREFDPQGGKNASVPDPYYEGIDGFEEVYGIIDRSVKGLFEALESGQVEIIRDNS